MRTTWRPETRTPPALGASMTPLIDVVFLLLIFFVCTASFQPAESSLPSDLLLSGVGWNDLPLEQEPELERIVIRGQVEPAGVRWAVNDRPCAGVEQLQALLSQLARIDAGLPVVIDPDPKVTMHQVIQAYDLARQAGLRAIKFAVKS